MNKKFMRFYLPVSLLVFIAAILIYCLFRIIPQYLKYQVAAKEYDAISELAYAETPEEVPAPAEYMSPIDFEALQEINPEICGWICIEGTAIDYPIVQTSDNAKYLSVTFSGEENPSGAIFMDRRNAQDFSDENTIIYGHHMKNGSMFAALTKYKEQSFYDDHPSLIIYTPDGEYVYDIFSAYVTPTDSLTYTFEFSDRDAFSAYFNYAVDCSMIQTYIKYKDSNEIITLSTCDYTFDNARMVVHALARK